MTAVNWTQSTTFYNTKSTAITSNVVGNGWLSFWIRWAPWKIMEATPVVIMRPI